MIRYIRLYFYFIRFSFSKAMEFRVDFFFRVIMDIIFYITQYLFFNIIYLHTTVLGGWNHQQMSVFIASFICVDALFMTIFATNAWWFPVSINRGDLDYYLTRPASAFFFFSLKEFAANSLINLILAIGLLTYFIFQIPEPINSIKIIGYTALLLNGTFLYFMINMLFLFSVFWTQSPRGFGEVFFSAEKIFQRPDGIFTGYFRKFFIYILPFSVVASYPTRFLFEKNISSIIYETVLASMFIYILVYFLWKKGLRDYSSASS